MNALFKYLIIALAYCGDFAFGISYPVSYGTATKDTVYAHGKYIVVERGCRLNIVKQDSSVNENLPQDSLLAKVYGNIPSSDSVALYEAWANECDHSVSGNIKDGFLSILTDIGFAALGVYLTFLHDYDYVGTAVLGRTYGVMLLICVPMVVSMGIHHFAQSSRQRDLGKFYKKESERFKLHVSPTINFNEPGGGLMLQLGF